MRRLQPRATRVIVATNVEIRDVQSSRCQSRAGDTRLACTCVRLSVWADARRTAERVDPRRLRVDFPRSGCSRKGMAHGDTDKRGERLAGQRIVAGIDESYFDADDEFWRPIREADERDAAAHQREVRKARGCQGDEAGAVQRRRDGGGRLGSGSASENRDDRVKAGVWSEGGDRSERGRWSGRLWWRRVR